MNQKTLNPVHTRPSRRDPPRRGFPWRLGVLVGWFFGVQGLGFRVRAGGFRVLGFRVWGFGF